jgi:hypothetical protein
LIWNSAALITSFQDDVTARDGLDVAALVQASQQRVVLGDVVRDLARTVLDRGRDDVGHIWESHDENSSSD